ncbi:UV DNA damage repair endonuclease UvsE [Paenibacillus sp. 1P07SE]|uniref:UV DNA damage repair endonuclease UvsE n=1 Tax=Paenibacillus sp. 1P07SE TaxID=3132209 RepID=UPI0039A5ADDF
MIVRFGFVAMSMLLENASPSRTMTYRNFSRLPDREAAVRRLERLGEENLHNTLRVLRHAAAHDIKVYRLSSKLIPLATHEALADWDPVPALAASFARVGEFVRRHGIRASFHPDHFCVLNTPRPEVLEKSVEDLEMHIRMLEALGLDEAYKCNIHVGGAYGDKPASGERFLRQFAAIDERYRHRITLENDDKTFTAAETLQIAEAAGVPMVLDIHHHAVNSDGLAMTQLTQKLWPRIAATWAVERERALAAGLGGGADALQTLLAPKVHASSPKSAKDPRSHADGVETGPLLAFLSGIAGSVPRVDVMLEAKQKDAALMQLMDELRSIADDNGQLRFIDDATVEING